MLPFCKTVDIQNRFPRKIRFLKKKHWRQYISDESLHTCSLDEPRGNQDRLKAMPKMFYHKNLLKIISFTVPLFSHVAKSQRIRRIQSPTKSAQFPLVWWSNAIIKSWYSLFIHLFLQLNQISFPSLSSLKDHIFFSVEKWHWFAAFVGWVKQLLPLVHSLTCKIHLYHYFT